MAVFMGHSLTHLNNYVKNGCLKPSLLESTTSGVPASLGSNSFSQLV